MACHEIRGRYQIGGSDGAVTETQVRAGISAGLLGIVIEVTLAVLGSVVSDDLDGVLVGTYSTVGTETVELALVCTLLGQRYLLTYRQGLVCHIICDTDGEVCLGLVLLEVLEHCEYLGRTGVFGRKTVTSADHERSISAHLGKCRLDIKIERFADTSRLLAAVQDSNSLDALGQYPEEILGRERSVKTDCDYAHLLLPWPSVHPRLHV